VVDTAAKSNFMQLLNANSYQKGGWVLHMLRRKLGDSLFWKGIRAYYAKYDGGNANTDDFKKVMAQASGQNLDQFVKQWLYTAGAPHLTIRWTYDEPKRNLAVTIKQNQDIPFEFPLEFSIDGKLQMVSIKDKVTAINLSVLAKPVVFLVDPNVNLLASFEVTENK
jgi:aminopeptidase N